MSRSSNTPVCPTSYTPCLLDLSPYCSLFSLTLLQTPLSLSCSSNTSGKLLLKVFLLPVQLFLYLPDPLFKFLKATCPHTHTDKTTYHITPDSSYDALVLILPHTIHQIPYHIIHLGFLFIVSFLPLELKVQEEKVFANI